MRILFVASSNDWVNLSNNSCSCAESILSSFFPGAFAVVGLGSTSMSFGGEGGRLDPCNPRPKTSSLSLLFYCTDADLYNRFCHDYSMPCSLLVDP
ncbi:6925_t:CDS:2 [Dentiscutata erythropus]|uniref:6925_t:CDS:1 n=1 Tax=Dentiscutata erythropus TaxID=1348616 RepID=A0A9N8W872_9GLOM|nr:6925_t:CDS:2 [Dentiscutata erythropus]